MKVTIAFAIMLLLVSPAFGYGAAQASALNSAATTSSPAASVEAGSTSPHITSPSSTVGPGSNSSTFAPAGELGSRYNPGPDYVIALGDGLRIFVWKEPEFSSSVQVRSDGKISLPLLDDVQAVGYKPMALAASLAEKLKKYVDDPRVTVIVTAAHPPIFYMVGQVGRQGAVSLTPNLTVLEALISANPSTFANTKKIYVLRVENGVEHRLPVNYKKLVKGKGVNQNLLLKPGDMVVVP